MTSALRLPRLRRRHDNDATAPLQIAEVDARGGRLFVSPLARTPEGLWQAQDWVREVPADADAETVGAVVEEALARSGEGHVKEEGEIFAAQLQAAGVKSWSQYVKGLTAARVEREGPKTEVLPLRNRGARRGLEGIFEEEEALAEPSTAQLGQAVKRALERSAT